MDATEEYQNALKELDQLRGELPRPIAKLYGSNGPNETQLAEWKEKTRVTKNKMVKIQRKLPALLERVNNEFRRKII